MRSKQAYSHWLSIKTMNSINILPNLKFDQLWSSLFEFDQALAKNPIVLLKQVWFHLKENIHELKLGLEQEKSHEIRESLTQNTWLKNGKTLIKTILGSYAVLLVTFYIEIWSASLLPLENWRHDLSNRRSLKIFS